MMNEKNFDRLENYLDDELNEKEILDLEKDLMDDLDLKMELNLHTEINEAIMEEDIMDLRSKLKAIEIPSTTEEKRKMKFHGKWRIAAASMILFIGIASVYYMLGNKSYTNKEIFIDYYKPYSIVINTRSSETNDSEKVIYRALKSYESKDFRSALSLFESVLEKDSMNLTSNFYSGISNIQIQEYPKANKNFTRVLEHKNNLFIEQSEWYLGICYLMTNEREKAKVSFRSIAKGNSFYRTKAKEILNKLE